MKILLTPIIVTGMAFAMALVAVPRASSALVRHEVRTTSAPAPGGASEARLTNKQVTQAYASWLRKRYPGARGYWTCPINSPYDVVSGGLGALCKAELHAKNAWHRLTTIVKLSPNSFAFVARLGDARSTVQTWVRAWSQYQGMLPVPGTAAVNSPYYDWYFLSGQAYEGWKRHERTFKVWAYDGPSDGYQRFYSFTCRSRDDLVVCTNALGDSEQYRPTR